MSRAVVPRKRVVKSAHERRSELLDAARDVFQRRGTAQSTVDEITSTAGVAKGTFYRYFDSKEEIVLALRVEVGARLLADLGAKAGTEWRTPEEWWFGAETLVELFIGYLLDNADEHRALFHDPGIAIATPVTGVFTAVPALLKEGVARGVFATDDPDLTWVILFAAIHGLADHALDTGPIDRDRVVSAATDLIRSVLAP